jgi:hypothetical protein
MKATNGLHVVHDIPGRLRLRLPPGAQTAGLPDAVAAEAGVAHCRWSPRTRSLLVLYEPETVSAERILDAVAQVTSLHLLPALDEPREALPDAPPAALTPRIEPGRALAVGVREAFGELDHRVQRATRGVVGLTALVPLALTAWALRELIRGRTRPLTWSTALWYAHGLFRDYAAPAAED